MECEDLTQLSAAFGRGCGHGLLTLLHLFHVGLQVADELLEVFAFSQRLQARIGAELVVIVESRVDQFTQGLDRPIGESAAALLAGQRRSQRQMMGEVVKVALLLLRDVLADLDGLAHGLAGIRAFAGFRQRFALARQQFGPHPADDVVPRIKLGRL